jgi:hypothetical protein
MAEFTPEQQIRRARAILDRSTTTRGWWTTNDLTELLTGILPVIERAPVQQRLASKANKAKFAALDKTLKRARGLNRQLQKIDPTGEWDQFAPVLQQRIGFCKQRLDLPLSPRPCRYRSTYAVNIAWLLLYDRGLPIIRSYDSDWLKLAKILYGDDDVDLYGSLKLVLGWRERWFREIVGDE